MAKKKQIEAIPTYLEWCDAYANSAWHTTEAAVEWAESGDWVIKEMGWIIKETKEYILFGSRWQPESYYASEKFGLIQKIPKTWIRKRKVLKL